jgi:hypothetical protein
MWVRIGSRTVVVRLSVNRRRAAGYWQPSLWHQRILVAVAEMLVIRGCVGGVGGVLGVVVAA